MKRLTKEKIKGISVFTAGVAWIIFIYCFDEFFGRARIFAYKSWAAFGLGLIALVNGVRIFLRK